MNRQTHFRVDPKLAHVLGESYSSSEKALKELVDNAWDAEATEVHITVPTILTDAPIIVKDNGSGMKTAELESEYLNIASPRFSRKGDRTHNLNRTVKGGRIANSQDSSLPVTWNLSPMPQANAPASLSPSRS
ncbi:MAG: hypothetical protein HC845_14270 [Akkermansiaceae bacterium]|nr:hypothetical protein [Akkermansiaceae bacterium]